MVEVHGHRGPHMANNGRYYFRRNLLVRAMTAAEVEDGYRQKFVRERSIFGAGEQEAADGEGEARIKQGLSDVELAAYRQETSDDRPPGWLSVWTHPAPLVPDLLDPRHHDVYEFRQLQVAELWRNNPLDYLSLVKTNSGFVGRLPPEDDGYPAYFVRFWADGLLEYGVCRHLRSGIPTRTTICTSRRTRLRNTCTTSLC